MSSAAGTPRPSGADHERVVYASTPGWQQPATLHASAAVEADGLLFTSGHFPGDPVAGPPASGLVDPRESYWSDVLETDTRSALANLSETAVAAGRSVEADIGRIYWWLRSDRPSLSDFEQGSLWTGIDDVAPAMEARDAKIWDPQPATTGIGIREHLFPGANMVIDGIFARGGAAGRTSVDTTEHGDLDGRPSVVRCGDWVYATAVPTDLRGDFRSGVHMGPPSAVAPDARPNPYLWYGSPVELQTTYVLERLDRLVSAAGSSLARCVRAEVYIGHPADLYHLDRAWRKYFGDRLPARVVVPFSGIAGRGWRVEIGVQCLAGDSERAIDVIETSAAPEPRGAEPQAIRAGDLLFLSTQAPLDDRGKLAQRAAPDPRRPYHESTARRQMSYVLENVSAICEAGGSSLEQLCRRQAFYDDLADFASMNDEWSRHFPLGPPASTDVRVGAGWPLLAEGSKLVMDLIGYAPREPGGNAIP